MINDDIREGEREARKAWRKRASALITPRDAPGDWIDRRRERERRNLSDVPRLKLDGAARAAVAREIARSK